MARGTRQKMRERLDASVKLVSRVQEYLVENGETYAADGHGDIKAQYEVVFAFAEELKNLLVSLSNTY